MKRNNHIIIIAIALLFVGCALKPRLTPVNLFQVDIGKDGKMYFELVDSHRKVVEKNKTNLPGIHHDVDEDNYLPQPLVQYLEKNIINNLKKSPGLEFMIHKNESEYLIRFELKHFDVYRETSGGAAAANFLIGGLIGQAMIQEDFHSIIEGEVLISDSITGNVVCSFLTNVDESIVIGIVDTGLWKSRWLVGYEDITEQATSELIKQIILGLSSCN